MFLEHAPSTESERLHIANSTSRKYDFGTLVYSINVLCVAMVSYKMHIHTDSNSADMICRSYSEEPSHRDVPLFSNSIVLLVQLVVLSLLLTESCLMVSARRRQQKAYAVVT